MSTGTIKAGADSFVINTVMPTEWASPTSVTVSIYRLSGTNLIDAQAVTLYAGDTTAAAITRGTKTCTLVTGETLKDGETVIIGSDAYGWHEMVVDSYASATKIVTLRNRFQEDLPVGVSVLGRNMSADIDTSDWDFIEDVSVVWTPVGISNLPWTETYSVLDREALGSGLETRFATEFGDYYSHVGQSFQTFLKSAKAMVDRQLRTKNRDLKKIVDSAEYEYLLMTRIALNIAIAHGDEFDNRSAKLQQSYEDQLSILISVYQWEDENQDLAQDETEVNKGSTIGYGRGM